MEQLCIRSFLQYGHEFHLFVYDPPENVPAGTVLLDAGRVLHRDRVFTNRDHPTVAGFSNSFRYKMLLENGGWWVDMDTVCVAPFDFIRSYVFSSEGIGGNLQINSGMIKTPTGSDVMRRAWIECEQMDTQQLEWGQSGPLLLNRLVREFALQHCWLLPTCFAPCIGQNGENCWTRQWSGSFPLTPARFTCGTSCGGGKGRMRIGHMTPTAYTKSSSANT